MWLLASSTLQILQENTCQMGKNCPFRHSQKENRSTGPQRKRQRKRVRTRDGNGCNCEYCESPSEAHFRDAVTVRNFHEEPLESGGKPRARRFKNLMKDNIALERKNFRQKRDASNSHVRVWREQDSETNFRL